MKTIIITTLALLAFFVIKAEGPDKTKNVEFTRANFAGKLADLKFAIQEIKTGDNLAEEKGWSYIDALPHYLNAYSVNPSNAVLNYKIGLCYLNTFNKTQSLSYLEDAYKLNPEVSPDILFQLGKSYHLNYQFDKAIENYQSFLWRKNIPERTKYEAEIKLLISQARNGILYVNNPKNYLLLDLGSEINSVNPDYCPVISPDGKTLYFTSRRPETTGGGKDEKDHKYNEDIYVSYANGQSWSKAENMGLNFNSKSHDATVGISADGSTLMIYRGDNGGDLYFASRTADGWGKIKKFPEGINTRYKESSAIFSPDGSILYFTSDRPGGFGGLDIWIAYQKLDGSWTYPINGGPVLNTQYDEEGVSLNEDGTVLYFSSKGHSSMGGYDVFKTYAQPGGWSQPENMGYPLNTPDDDVFFTFTGKEEFAFFSSERNDGRGSQDIYSMQLKNIRKSYKINLSTIVTDMITGEKINGANVEIRDHNGNLVGSFFNINPDSNIVNIELDGEQSYEIYANADRFFANSREITLPASEEVGIKVNENIALIPADIENVFLPVVFFDFDKYDLRPKSVTDLDSAISIINLYPQSKIVIGGHTDIVGSMNYNIVLSKKRAEVVKNYLISHGIAEKRIIIDGYGYNMPWAPNTTDEGRQINRRAEIRFAPMQ